MGLCLACGRVCGVEGVSGVLGPGSGSVRLCCVMSVCVVNQDFFMWMTGPGVCICYADTCAS